MGCTSAGGLLVGKLVVIGKGTSERKSAFRGKSRSEKEPGRLNGCVLSRQPGIDRNPQHPKDLVLPERSILQALQIIGGT
jgi:hypothetical protein